jgi:superoxide dismutase
MEADFQQEILTAIESAFGTFEEFKAKFSRQEQHNLVQVGLGFVLQVEN